MVRIGLAVGGAVLVLLGVAALMWGSTRGPWHGEWYSGSGHTSQQTRTSALGEVTGVQLAGGSGDVQVNYAPGGAGQVRQQVHRDGEDSGPEKPFHRLEGGTLVLPTDCGWNCTVDYAVTLPAPVEVTGQLGSGDADVSGMRSVDARVGAGAVRVRDVDGPVRARSASGEIALNNVGGPVDAETSSGHVEGDGVRGGEVAARASSGDVDLRLTDPRSVEANSTTGDVRLSVPPGPYRVDASAGSGEESVEVPRDPAAPRQLRLATNSGTVDVHSS